MLGVRHCVVGSGCGTQLHKSYATKKKTNTTKRHFSEIGPRQIGFRERTEYFNTRRII